MHYRVELLVASLFILYSIFSFLSFSIANAASASMFLTPTASSYSVGQTFPVAVKVNTGGASINAAEGKVSYDPQRLSVVSISKSESIFSLWTDEPADSSGIIKFGGGVPNPGFTGSAGNIISIMFKAREPGDTTVNFISGAVLANDGKGTNILSNLGGSNYSINPSSYIPSVQAPVEVAAGTPAAPLISSPTHPDSDKWYSRSDASFTWEIPPGMDSVRLLIGKLTVAIPTVTYTPAIKKKTVDNLEDGIWYFHARFRNSKGWGQVAHFPLKIDTIPPAQFNITVDNEGNLTNPSPLLVFGTTDATSGIANYEIIIDSQEGFLIVPKEVSSGSYKIPPQAPGKHSVVIKAIDKAGNFTPATADVTISAISAPAITDYPERLSQGSQLIIKGVSLPDHSIIVSVESEDESPVDGETVADGSGNWRYVHHKSLEDRGVYNVWATARDSRGALSEKSESVTILVTPPLFLKFGEVAIDYLTTMITLVILILGFAFAIFYGWYRTTQWRRQLRKEVQEVDESVTNAFQMLYEDTQEQFDILEGIQSKRELTKEEKKILSRLKRNLKTSEQFIKKEIRDVKREIE